MFLSAKDFRTTGRRPNAKGEVFSFEDSLYADDTAILFVDRSSAETYCPLLVQHFKQFGMEIHVGDKRNPNSKSKTEILLVAAPSSTYNDPSTYDGEN